MSLSKLALGAAAGVAALAAVSLAFASQTPFGGTTFGGGFATLVSNTDANPSNDFSGIDFDEADGLSFAELETLATDFNVTDDDCGAGSPRVQVGLDSTGDGIRDGNVHIAIGPSPTFTGCAAGWQSTGNLIGNEDTGRYDSSAFGGSPFEEYSDTLARVGAYEITGIQVVVDGGFFFLDGEQTIRIDNVNVQGTIHTFSGPPADTDACKDGGWMTFDTPREFTNQGDCIQFVNTGK